MFTGRADVGCQKCRFGGSAFWLLRRPGLEVTSRSLRRGVAMRSFLLVPVASLFFGGSPKPDPESATFVPSSPVSELLWLMLLRIPVPSRRTPALGSVPGIRRC